MAIITGTSGNDSLNGTTGDDELRGLEGNDTLNGGSGNDLLDGGAGADVLNGNGGTNTASYANSAAAVWVDLIAGTGLGGDAEGDVLSGIARVIGSAFDDVLTGRYTFTLEGGAGNDTYIMGPSTGDAMVIVEAVGGGTDEVRTARNTITIASNANVENLTFTGTTGFNGTGNSGNNVITGGDLDDILVGLAGADVLNGGLGDDTLYAGDGTDTVNGGDGFDWVSYGDAAGGVTINLKTGVKTGFAAGDVYSSIEGVIGTVSADTFVSGADVIRLLGGGGTDTVDYSSSGAGVQVDLLAGIGTGGDAEGDSYNSIERAIGSAFDDVLTGRYGNTLEGGAGNDIYIMGPSSGAAMAIVEAVGGGTDEVRTALGTITIASNTNVENLTYTGTAGFNATGNSGNNVITGGLGTDNISGGAGNDILVGGSGNDNLNGGANNDRYVFAAGFGRDSIVGFVAGAGSEDIIEFSTAVFANFAAVQAAATQVGSNTVIFYDANNTVTLTGVGLSSLHADDFGFF